MKRRFLIGHAMAALLLASCTENDKEESPNASIQVIQPVGSAYLVVFPSGNPICLAEALDSNVHKKSGTAASPQAEVVLIDSITNLDLLAVGDWKGRLFVTDPDEGIFLGATITITGKSSSRLVGSYKRNDTTGNNIGTKTTHFNARRCPDIEF